MPPRGICEIVGGCDHIAYCCNGQGNEIVVIGSSGVDECGAYHCLNFVVQGGGWCPCCFWLYNFFLPFFKNLRNVCRTRWPDRGCNGWIMDNPITLEIFSALPSVLAERRRVR